MAKEDNGCKKVQGYYFCIDDTSKLKTHDKYALANFLANTTNIKYQDKPCYGEGQWFVEKINDKSVHVSVMCAERFIGDIVVSLIQRGGKFYYVETEK